MGVSGGNFLGFGDFRVFPLQLELEIGDWKSIFGEFVRGNGNLGSQNRNPNAATAIDSKENRPSPECYKKNKLTDCLVCSRGKCVGMIFMSLPGECGARVWDPSNGWDQPMTSLAILSKYTVRILFGSTREHSEGSLLWVPAVKKISLSFKINASCDFLSCFWVKITNCMEGMLTCLVWHF